MPLQQLTQPTIVVRRNLVPAVGLAILVVLIAALLGARSFAPATQLSNPEIERVMESWSPGGHITGSVYDGGDDGVKRLSTGAPMTHLTGSVYEPE